MDDLKQEPNDGLDNDEDIFSELNDRERLFVVEYCKDPGNATQAVIRAGFTKNAASAAVTGSRLLRNAKVLAAKEAYLAAICMSGTDALRHMADIATTRLNDYMVVKKVLKSTTVRKPLQQLINELDAEIEFEEEFARIAKLSGPDLVEHKAEQKRRELKGIRYALELERNPNAYRDVPGEAKWVEEASVDLVKLARAKDRGRIKSLSYTEHGPRVELYAADAALSRIIEASGKIIQKHEHSGPNGGPIPVQENRTWTIINHTGGKTPPAPDDDYNKSN